MTLPQREMIRYRRVKMNQCRGYSPDRLKKVDVFDLEELKDYLAHKDGSLKSIVKKKGNKLNIRVR
jgi:hypothetical protein